MRAVYSAGNVWVKIALRYYGPFTPALTLTHNPNLTLSWERGARPSRHRPGRSVRPVAEQLVRQIPFTIWRVSPSAAGPSAGRRRERSRRPRSPSVDCIVPAKNAKRRNGKRQRCFRGRDKSYCFSDSAMNSNNAFVAGSSGRPRLSLSFVWLVSLAAKTLVGIPASFDTAARRCACAVVSG